MLKEDNNLVFKVKKTNELSEEELDQLLNLIRSTMNVERTKKKFKDKYLKNFLGYSFHALMIKESTIVGCNTVIPQEFIYFSEKHIFGQWCETLIDKNFRGNFSNFKKLGLILDEILIKHNISFVYGLPNKSLYVVSKRLLGMKDIGKLNYYVYPSRMNKFFNRFYPLNIIICFFLKVLLKFKIKFNYDYNFKIHKLNNVNFFKSRYPDDENYKHEINDNFKFTYKIETSIKHNNAKIIWIIDIDPLNKSNLEEAVNNLIKKNYNQDLIIFIGNLKIIPYNLIKIPNKFIEEHNVYSGKIINNEKIKENIFNSSNWNINSSNFDYK